MKTGHKNIENGNISNITVVGHDAVAECENCKREFSHDSNRKDIIWECPYCNTSAKINSYKMSDGGNITSLDSFKKWFGNSVVVDENRKPLVVYHGSKEKFNEFDAEHQREGTYGRGFYFTQYKDMAGVYGKPMSVYLSIKNPVVVTPKKTPSILHKIIMGNGKYLYGYDGVIVKNNKDELETIVVFNSNQIKLADGTNKTFDGSNPDIRLKDGGNLGKIKVYRFYDKINTKTDRLRGGTFYTPFEYKIKHFDKKSKKSVEGLGGESKVVGFIEYKNPFILKTKNGWLHDAISKWEYKDIDYGDLLNDSDKLFIEDLTFSKYDEDIIPIIKIASFITKESRQLIIDTQDDTNKIYCVYDFFISHKLKQNGYDVLFISDNDGRIKEVFDINDLFSPTISK